MRILFFKLNSKKPNSIFIIRKVWNWCDQIFKAILDKNFKNLLLIFFLTLILLFLKIFSMLIQEQIYQIFSNRSKVIVVQKISVMKKIMLLISYLNKRKCHDCLSRVDNVKLIELTFRRNWTVFNGFPAWSSFNL